jgi:hypothetical protein
MGSSRPVCFFKEAAEASRAGQGRQADRRGVSKAAMAASFRRRLHRGKAGQAKRGQAAAAISMDSCG